jgi:hypothetical protein
LIATNKKDRWVFIYGFAKNERSNIDEDEEEALKKLAASLLLLSDESLAQSESKGKIIEVICDAEEKISDP